MELGESLFDLIHTVRSNILHKVKMLNVDLTPMHLKSLTVISNIEHCTGQKLAAVMGRDKAQINRLIKALVSQKLVVKKDNLEDKRSQLLVLTPAGLVIMEAFKQAEKEVFEKMLVDVPHSQLTTFIDTAKQLRANLEPN
ncbi:MarR family winged helix-turn-helix transcriptional regulator [Thalassotalea euphylliae]|nr:MarR family transcriptional regulator [Thalassotalea euphylliae]